MVQPVSRRVGLKKRIFIKPVPLRTQRIRLNPVQQSIFSFLMQTKGASEGAALRVALKPQNNLDRVRQALALIESVKLDPNVYGVERIPVKYYENALAYSQSKIKNWLIPSMKNQLMDDHAVKILNQVFPEWKERKVSRQIHPALLLNKWRLLKELGLEPINDNLVNIPLDRSGTMTRKVLPKRDPKLVEARIQALREAGVPLRYVGGKIKLPQEEFDSLIARYKAGHKFTATQEKVYNYLKTRGASEEVSFTIASRKRVTLASVRKKFDYIEDLELDREIYGLTKLPLNYYEKLLVLPIHIFKIQIKKQVLDEFEKRTAARMLDKEFPGWRKMKKLKRMRTLTILRRVRELRARGLTPNAWLIRSKSEADIFGEGKIITGRQIKKTKTDPNELRKEFRRGGPVQNYQPKVNEFIGENNIPRSVFGRMVDAYSEIFGETKQRNLDYVTQKLMERVNARAHIVPYEKMFKFASRAIYGYWKKEETK